MTVFPGIVQFFGNFSVLFLLIYWGLLITVHVSIAVGVSIDAAGLRRSRSGPLFAGPLVWMLATLLGGVLAAGIYWVIHHSTLRPMPNVEGEPKDVLE
jgi:hypothetical protein